MQSILWTVLSVNLPQFFITCAVFYSRYNVRRFTRQILLGHLLAVVSRVVSPGATVQFVCELSFGCIILAYTYVLSSRLVVASHFLRVFRMLHPFCGIRVTRYCGTLCQPFLVQRTLPDILLFCYIWYITFVDRVLLISDSGSVAWRGGLSRPGPASRRH